MEDFEKTIKTISFTSNEGKTKTVFLRGNKSNVMGDGSRHKSNNYGYFTIVGSINKKRTSSGGKTSFSYFLIRFDDGTYLETTRSAIISKAVKNANFPIVSGVGFVGQGCFSSNRHGCYGREYKLWTSLINRCYNKKCLKSHPAYSDCSVDKRWHNFQNFCEDIRFLEGYDLWKNVSTRHYHLDKDIKITGNRVYSKDSCIFVHESINIAHSLIDREKTLTGKEYKAINIDTKKEIIFNNMSEFCRDYGFNIACVCNCINGKQKRTKRWRFIVL